MSAPERIHVNWNASDGFARLRQHGFESTQHNPPDPKTLMEVLAQEKGRLFRLIGWTGMPEVELLLKIEDYDESGLHVSNNKPPFKAIMTVADEPLPYVTMNGDYIFDLINISS